MDELISNDPDSCSPEQNNEKSSKSLKPSIVAHHHVKPYYNVLLTKRGIEKIKHTDKSIFDLPLCDLRDPPHMAQIYTIGDLVRFIDKHQYIKNALESQEFE